jgi:RNA polymerase sigma-70 factor (ECF subfamily)
MPDLSSDQLQDWFERLQDGDVEARNALITQASDRLLHLTHKMLEDFPRLRRWLGADDVFQNAVLRLIKALRTVRPTTAVEFFRLAARQVRRELLDLTRHYFGPEGMGAHHASVADAAVGSTGSDPPIWDGSQSTHDPQRLAAWGAFHERVKRLPEEEREVFDLLWYLGRKQGEVASLLGISVPTVKRRWLGARLKLQKELSPFGPTL